MAALDQRELVGVCIVARHGARYPNCSELGAFSAYSAIRRQWHDGAAALYESDDNLRDVGRRQMEALGV